jgi:hypothetical protein
MDTFGRPECSNSELGSAAVHIPYRYEAVPAGRPKAWIARGAGPVENTTAAVPLFTGYYSAVHNAVLGALQVHAVDSGRRLDPLGAG